MAAPSVTVEMAFGHKWSDDPDTFTWEDVSSYVKDFQSVRGRSTELDLFTAGRCSFILDSPARRFDPLNAAGPYYGELVPRVPVRAFAEVPQEVTVFEDTFDSPTLGDAWEIWGQPENVALPGDGTLTLNGSARVGTASRLNVERAAVVVELADPGSSGFFANALFAVQNDQDNTGSTSRAFFSVTNGTTMVAGVETPETGNATTSVSYSAVDHRYLRIEITADEVVLSASPDGESWTEVYSRERGGFTGNAYIVLQASVVSGTPTVWGSVAIVRSSLPVFYGYVDSWKHVPGTKVSTVSVQATDAFRDLANLRMREVYEQAVLEDAPALYCPLAGTDGDLAADMSGNGRHGTYVGTAIERGVSGLRPFSTGIRLDGDTASYVIWPDLPSLDTILGNTFTIEFWCQNLDSDVLWQAPGLAVTVDFIDGFMTIRTWTQPTTNYLTVDPSTFDMDDPDATNFHESKVRHVVITVNGGAPTLYVDGEERRLWSQAGPALTGSELFSISYPDGSPQVAMVGAISDLAFYDSVLSTDRIEAHYEAGRSPWFGDRTGERVERILDLIGWPSGLRTLDIGEVVCGNADTAGTTVLEYLQVLALTEGGRFFVSADGNLVFHGAHRTVIAPSSYTFADDGDGTGILVGGLTFSLDDTFVYDGAEVQKKYGVTQYAGAEFPTRMYSATGLAMRDDAVARTRAERIVNRYKTPQTRAEEFEVSLNQHNVSDWGDVLALEIGDVVTVSVTPQGSGDPLTLQLFVEQITHRSRAGSWRTTFYGSPVDDRNLFRFDGPNTVGSINGFDVGVFR